jgi:hypothetical protein
LVLIAHDVCVDRRTQLTKIAGPAPFDNYNQPVLAPADWFSGIDKLVKGILVWGGEQEAQERVFERGVCAISRRRTRRVAVAQIVDDQWERREHAGY